MESPLPKGSSVRMYSFEFVEQTKRLRADWRSYLFDHLKAGCTEIWHDLRSVRWLRALLWFLYLAWLAGIVLAIVAICLGASFSYDDYSYYEQKTKPQQNCRPDGSFSLNPKPNDMWRPSGFFQITMGFGQLTFGRAKFIDIAFDIIVGRGGQFLLALVSCRVFAEYVTSQMEITPVSYGTYKTIFLREGPSFWSTVGLMREFICFRALNSRLAMTWMILSAAYIVAFPTLASAMSGYSGNNLPFILDPATQNLLLWADFDQIDYIVHDGQRIGLSENFVFTNKYEECYSLNPTLGSSYSNSNPYGSATWNNSICKTKLDISNYVQNYGFFAQKQTNSTFRNFTLPSPVLNVSAFYIQDPDTMYYYSSRSMAIFGNNWTDPRTGQMPFSNKSQTSYASINSNETFSTQMITQLASCQPSSTYKWGFSFLILFITLLLLLIWTVGMHILWLKAHLALRDRGEPTAVGEYKAIVELADSLTTSFRALGDKAEILDETQIRRRIRQDLNGGSMAYQSPLRGESYSFWAGFKRWCRKDKWWVLALLTATFVMSISGPFGQFGLLIFASFVFSGVLLARWICTTRRARGFMIAFWVFWGVIVAPISSAELAYYYT